jgi:hypothetical protein
LASAVNAQAKMASAQNAASEVVNATANAVAVAVDVVAAEAIETIAMRAAPSAMKKRNAPPTEARTTRPEHRAKMAVTAVVAIAMSALVNAVSEVSAATVPKSIKLPTHKM